MTVNNCHSLCAHWNCTSVSNSFVPASLYGSQSESESRPSSAGIILSTIHLCSSLLVTLQFCTRRYPHRLVSQDDHLTLSCKRWTCCINTHTDADTVAVLVQYTVWLSLPSLCTPLSVLLFMWICLFTVVLNRPFNYMDFFTSLKCLSGERKAWNSCQLGGEKITRSFQAAVREVKKRTR